MQLTARHSFKNTKDRRNTSENIPRNRSDGPFPDVILDHMYIPYVYRAPAWAGTLSLALDAMKDEGHLTMPH
jgi:hypothetical protein